MHPEHAVRCIPPARSLEVQEALQAVLALRLEQHAPVLGHALGLVLGRAARLAHRGSCRDQARRLGACALPPGQANGVEVSDTRRAKKAR